MTIEELEIYFTTTQLPETIQLNPGAHIPNVLEFVNKELHLARFEETRTPAFDRLLQLKEVLDESPN